MKKFALLSLSLTACVPGVGTAKFTTWGEEYIEQEIPADPTGEAGFVDGWRVHYDKFLVTFHGVEVASEDGTIGARMSGSKLVDNARPGKKDLVTFEDLEARAWDAVSYEIKPATATTELIGGATEADVGRPGWLWLHRPEGWASDPAFAQRSAAGSGPPPGRPGKVKADVVERHRTAVLEMIFVGP